MEEIIKLTEDMTPKQLLEALEHNNAVLLQGFDARTKKFADDQVEVMKQTFATKDDLKTFATKTDFNDLGRRMDSIQDDITLIKRHLGIVEVNQRD